MYLRSTVRARAIRRKRLLLVPCCLLILLQGGWTMNARSMPALRDGRAQTTAQHPLGPGIRTLKLLVEPQSGTRPLTAILRHAKRSVDLTMYLLTDHTMIHDLERAHAAGVRLRVLLEHHPFGDEASGTSANQSAYDQLMAADIPVRWTSARFLLTHQKTLLVDGESAVIMTQNFTWSAFPSIA